MAAANRLICDAFTSKFEGGNVNNPHDPGGRTSRGVTQRVYDADRARRGLPRQSVYQMTESERASIYKRGYWDAVRGDELRPGEDLVTYDFGVNSGPARALRVLNAQRSKTRDLVATIEGVTRSRLSFLHGLGTWQYFGKGWNSRVCACEALAYRLAAGVAGAPAVLEKKAVQAETSKKKKVGVVKQTAATGSVTGAASTQLPPAEHWYSDTLSVLTICMIVAMVGMSIWYAFKASQESARAAALRAQMKGRIDGLPSRGASA